MQPEKAKAYCRRSWTQIRHFVGSAVADVVSTPLPLGQPAVLAELSAPAGAGRYSRVEVGVSGGRDGDLDRADDTDPGVR